MVLGSKMVNGQPQETRATLHVPSPGQICETGWDFELRRLGFGAVMELRLACNRATH